MTKQKAVEIIKNKREIYNGLLLTLPTKTRDRALELNDLIAALDLAVIALEKEER